MINDRNYIGSIDNISFALDCSDMGYNEIERGDSASSAFNCGMLKTIVLKALALIMSLLTAVKLTMTAAVTAIKGVI